MKLILSLLFPLIIATVSYGQVIIYDDFKSVIPFLQKEDFKGAFDKTSQLLSSTQNDSSDLRGIVIYMNIFSSAGMVTLDQMSHADFLKKANKYVGQRLVMSAHPYIDSSAHGYNSLQFFTKDGQLQGMTITANNTKTNILCFEYFKYAGPINPSEFIGKNVRCGGTLISVEVNPNNSKIWISRLHIGNAFARAM
ncbi:hypothetical protein IQ13_3985 [Lacibacter cauensis]|uniref:Uncharacterized protein n=1 Tax=Lacibacter cauensis TaxID=510947 RepID=A0A562SAV4_9BACT|nr:hypothetical protein [Lacibacter cauensis]TWI78303.1 hypothetical protein IQ13_3985 [Lacibacter cauensis]